MPLNYFKRHLMIKIMIISNHQLTAEHFDQLDALALRCRRQDGSSIPIYSHSLAQQRHLPCNVLYYHHRQLVGFLSVFFFYDNACEWTLMVDPAFRRRHIAAQLIATILPVIESKMVEHVICPSPKGQNDAWLSARGFVYQNSEMRMQWNRSTLPLNQSADLTFCQATDEVLIPELVGIDVACFHSEKREVELTYMRLIHDETYTLWIVCKNHQVIGKAHVHREISQVVISDIAILPDYQGHGYGQALVAYCLDDIRSTTTLPLCLDVDADNLNAVHIYEKLGFKSMNTCDRWMIAVQKLHD